MKTSNKNIKNVKNWGFRVTQKVSELAKFAITLEKVTCLI